MRDGAGEWGDVGGVYARIIWVKRRLGSSQTSYCQYAQVGWADDLLGVVR